MSPTPDSPSRLGHRIADWLLDYWLEIGLVLSDLVLYIAVLLLSDEVVGFLADDVRRQEVVQWWALVVVLIAAPVKLIFVGGEIWKRRRLSKLDNEMKVANEQHQQEHAVLRTEISRLSNERDLVLQGVQTFVLGYLTALSLQRLKTGEKGVPPTRVTLYSHDQDHEGGYFIPVARYSDDPEYRKLEDDRYPDGEGCIAKAWREGSAYIGGFPDPGVEPNDYLTYHENNGFPRDKAAKLSMKSRMYYGYRVRDKERVNPLAVVIVESTDPAFWTQAKLDRIFDSRERQFLRDMVGTLYPHFGVPSDAREAGF